MLEMLTVRENITLFLNSLLWCPIQAESLRAEEAARAGADAPILAVHLNRTFSALAGGSSRVSGWCVSGWVTEVRNTSPSGILGYKEKTEGAAWRRLCLEECLQTGCQGPACKQWPCVAVVHVWSSGFLPDLFALHLIWLQVAVQDLSLVVKRGECFGLLGPNGAGKTTAINMLTGFIEPTSGTGIVEGLDIRSDMPLIYKLMGVCPQHDLLWEQLSGREHLRFYGRLKGLEGELGQQ
jgi:hypothetical protein